MRPYDIIYKKRNGKPLTPEEIDFFVQGYVKGDVPDYQASALMMAIYFQGLNKEETVHLTQSMIQSGDVIDLSAINGIKVDKHSSGGVGDKTSIVLAPMVAAAGAKVAKMSGRGLGHTGGTIDKLEAITGFRTELSLQDFIDQVNDIGIALAGQSGNMVPADKKLYALRDVTATVENMSLIAGSIMSKKLASGADKIVLDVKCGEGAFMKNEADARQLAQIMVDIGAGVGKETLAVITDMRQPLGNTIGNALEIEEAIATVKGEGPADLYQVCLTLGSYMLQLAEVAPDENTARQLLEEVVANGAAFEKLKTWVSSQGGDVGQIDDPSQLPQAKYQIEVKAGATGYIQSIDAEAVGTAAMLLGAGRASKADSIDYAAGIRLHAKVGDRVEQGTLIATLYTNDQQKLGVSEAKLKSAYVFDATAPVKSDLILGVIQANATHA